MRATGILRASFNDRGFTFIAVDEPEGAGRRDVFLNIRDLADEEDSSAFVRGSRVEFEIVLVKRRSRDGTLEEKEQARDARLTEPAASPATVVQSGLQGSLKFWHPTGYGFIVADDGSGDFFVSGASVPRGYIRMGDVVQFDVAKQSTGDLQAVNVRVIDWVERGEPFDDLLDMGHPRWAEQLAGLAEPEPWNYPEKPAKDRYAILRSYVKYTFLRLNELPEHVSISADDAQLAFNTGLVTRYQEMIFAIFRKRTGDETGPPWILRGFEKASSPAFLLPFGGRVPPLAWYFDDPAQLVFDTRVQLQVNVEHVPHDPERFPEILKAMSPEDLAAQVNAKAPEAIERVRRNYKTAIPQYYRDGRSGNGKMQLLLPVALLSRDRVELALAVDRLGPEVYLGRTVLTLDWAYNNARLLTRPDTDWLRP